MKSTNPPSLRHIANLWSLWDYPTVKKPWSWSRSLVTDGEDMVNRDHACFFSAAHAAKDSGIALKLAREKGLNLPLAAATKAQYDRMIAVGLGDLDKSGIAGLTFPGCNSK